MQALIHCPTLIGIRKSVGSAEFRIVEGRIMQVLLYKSSPVFFSKQCVKPDSISH